MTTLLLRGCLVGILLFSGAMLVAPERFVLPGGNELTVSASPAIPGGTLTVPLGPVGDLYWKTHKTPVAIKARYLIGEQVRLPKAAALERIAGDYAKRKAPWVAVFALAAGGLFAHGLGSRKRQRALAAFAAVAIGGGIVGLAYATQRTFDPKALTREPAYRGNIADAQAVFSTLRDVPSAMDGAESKAAQIIAGIATIHRDLVGGTVLPEMNEGGTTLLVVGDLHNNHVNAVPMVRQLVEFYGVDAILNAGDVGDGGTDGEGRYAVWAFRNIAVPQVIAPGNHEAPAMLEHLRKRESWTVLEGANDVARIGDLIVLGAADPKSVLSDHNDKTTDFTNSCARLRERASEVHPDILLVHDQRLGACAARLAEEQKDALVYVWGHTHEQALEQRGSVVALSAGTSGKGGVWGGPSYGFAILDFTDGEITRACLVAFENANRLAQTRCQFY